MSNEETKFRISLENFQNLPIDKYEQDFTFIVHGQRYSTPRFVADCLSPKVRDLHFTDSSVSELELNICHQEDDSAGGPGHFSEFLNLCSMREENLSELLREEYSRYFLALGNICEYIHLLRLNEEPLTASKCVSVLRFLESTLEARDFEKALDSDKIEEVVSFVARHFYELESEEKKSLGKISLERIISREELRITDEDSLLEVILEKYDEDRSYAHMIGGVIFRNLGKESISKFVDHFCINDMDSYIWASISDRLVCNEIKPIETRYLSLFQKKNEKHQEDKRKVKEFKHEDKHDFEGIMRYLSKETGGNIHDNGTIEITTNSIWDDNSSSYHPKNLVDYQNNTHYYSKNEPNVFICFDFKDRRVQLSDYSIQTQSGGPNACHLRNWVLEVSNDKNQWEEIDRHSEDSTLRGPKNIGVFKIKEETNSFYRFIRLRQTGVCWCNDYRIYFPFIEFFGKISEERKHD